MSVHLSSILSQEAAGGYTYSKWENKARNEKKGDPENGPSPQREVEGISRMALCIRSFQPLYMGAAQKARRKSSADAQINRIPNVFESTQLVNWEDLIIK